MLQEYYPAEVGDLGHDAPRRLETLLEGLW